VIRSCTNNYIYRYFTIQILQNSLIGQKCANNNFLNSEIRSYDFAFRSTDNSPIRMSKYIDVI